ncbi:MAG: hypothetical protein GY803_26215 [Chloroflexi bacterium]|nr:hypothetical protein [Chloroflexota bacterium]
MKVETEEKPVDIVENLEQWRSDYQKEWLAHYKKTGELAWLNYPRAHNRTAPSGPGIDLAQSRLILISSAGGYLRGEQEPFDAANDLGDYSIRLFPSDTLFGRLAYAHEHYDQTAVSADPQVLLPLKHLQSMVNEGKIGELTPSVISFSGYMPNVERIVTETIPSIIAAAQAEQADGALLVPA